MSFHKKIIIAILFVLVGLTLIMAIPAKKEGPQLLYISEQHAKRLIDFLGLILAVPAWFYLNLIVVPSWLALLKQKVKANIR